MASKQQQNPIAQLFHAIGDTVHHIMGPTMPNAMANTPSGMDYTDPAVAQYRQASQQSKQALNKLSQGVSKAQQTIAPVSGMLAKGNQAINQAAKTNASFGQGVLGLSNTLARLPQSQQAQGQQAVSKFIASSPLAQKVLASQVTMPSSTTKTTTQPITIPPVQLAQIPTPTLQSVMPILARLILSNVTA